jgi:dopamine beta-monooxygenase
MISAMLLVRASLLASVAFGLPTYVPLIPNQGQVMQLGAVWDAVGHIDRGPAGVSGSLNPFGEAFGAANLEWSVVCPLDSDGDGITNGDELGDPLCVWTQGAIPARTTDITHPGFAADAVLPATLDSEAVADGTLGLTIAVEALPLFFFILGLSNSLHWLFDLKYDLGNLNRASILMVIAVVVGLIVFTRFFLDAGLGDIEITLVTGLSAGIAVPLPILWAFMKWGVHASFKVSREAAWRIHILLGEIALIFGLAHTISAYVAYTTEEIGEQLGWAIANVGYWLMVLGVLPAKIRYFAPQSVRYDIFKNIHYLSFLGYIFILWHIIDHLVEDRDVGARDRQQTTIAVFNIAVTALYAIQWVQQRASKSATLVEGEHVDGHVFLRLHAPKFRYVHGQWARLKIGSLSSVAHPFTIVPDLEAGYVQFFIKTSGNFTKKLAKAVENTETWPKHIHLEGPYGRPEFRERDIRAAVFVLGGVGVTPALSLVEEASKQCEGRVRMYWSLRSKGLLEKCAPIFEPFLNPKFQAISLNTGGGMKKEMMEGAGEAGGEAMPKPEPELPLGATTSRADLKKFLESTAEDFKKLGVGSKPVLVFVCGPGALASAVEKATRRIKTVNWRVHVETFEFLPSLKCGARPPERRAEPPKLMDDAPKSFRLDASTQELADETAPLAKSAEAAEDARTSE